MAAIKLVLPDLDKRFLPDEKWRILDFTNPQTGHYISYRASTITKPKASIVCLPGLSEFGEKYIETAKFFNEKGFDFYVIDWAYQGFSCRHQGDRDKRHSDGYDADISDLDHLITHCVEKKDVPLYLLCHSMGGHLGMRYILEHVGKVKCVSVTAPMMSIRALRFLTPVCRTALSFLPSQHDDYIWGEGNWEKSIHLRGERDILTNDPKRSLVHDAWSRANTGLRLGGPTYKWLYESLRSIEYLNRKETLKGLNVPFLLACAGEEELVDNNAIFRAAKFLPNDRMIILENAKHEVMMEVDAVRDLYLEETLSLFNRQLN